MEEFFKPERIIEITRGIAKLSYQLICTGNFYLQYIFDNMDVFEFNLN